jgi:hypothetical protein
MKDANSIWLKRGCGDSYVKNVRLETATIFQMRNMHLTELIWVSQTGNMMNDVEEILECNLPGKT